MSEQSSNEGKTKTEQLLQELNRYAASDEMAYGTVVYPINNEKRLALTNFLEQFGNLIRLDENNVADFTDFSLIQGSDYPFKCGDPLKDSSAATVFVNKQAFNKALTKKTVWGKNKKEPFTFSIHSTPSLGILDSLLKEEEKE